MSTTETISAEPAAEAEPVDFIRMQPLGNTNPSPAAECDAVTRRDIAPVAEDETKYPTGFKFWLAIVNIGSLLILAGLDVNIVATAVPSITDHFHTVADVGWYSSAFRLCSCAFQFIFGKLYKLFSLKRVLLSANAIFLVGSLQCALAVSSSMFIVGRAIAGVGFAGILGGVFVILAHVLPLRRRPLFCGILGAVESVAVLAAPIVGGALTQTVGWRWCFWINIPLGGATFLLTLLLDDPKPSDTSRTLRQKVVELDIVSNMLLIPGLTCLFIALAWAGTKYSWSDGRVIGLLVAFTLLTAGFAYNQHRRGDGAALPPRVLSNRNVLAAAIFTMCTNSAINVLEYYLPTYYQVVLEYPPSKSGYMMMPIVVGATIGMFICGSGTSMVGYYAPFMLLSSVLMPIFAGLITTFGVDTSFARLILFSGASGFASGVGFNAPVTAVQTVLPTQDVSLGVSVVLFAQNLGPAVFVAIAQVIFTNEFAAHAQKVVPGLSAVGSGLTDIVAHAPAEMRKGVGRSLSETWYLAVGLTCATLVGSLLMEWRSVKRKSD